MNVAHIAPVANAVTVSGTEGQVASGTINATDAITSAVLTPSVVSAPAHGTVVLNVNGTFTYTPATGFSGADTFTYEVNDGTVNSNVATITVNVAHVAPVANGVTINGTEGQVASGTINATDAITSAVLTPSVVTAPAHGAVALNANGTFTYTPATGYSGTDTFTYEVNDGSVNSNVATVTINVAHVAPVANAVTVSGTEGQVASGTINATDAITSAVLTPSVVTAPAHGTVALNANGTFTYTPATGFSGAGTFTYEVNDGTVNSNVATITVNVAHVAPVANGVTINGTEGQVASGSINATDAITSAVLTPSVVTAPAHGTVALNANGTFTYTPSTGYSGTDTFTYEVNDGSVNSNVATVTVNVAHVAPVANAVTVSGTEGQVASGTINATDAITSAVLTPSVVTAPAHGTVVLNANGTFTYTPTTGFSGADSFTYEVNDGTVNSNVATVTLSIAHVNPIVSNVTINGTEGQVASGSINATDAITSAVLTPSVVSAPAHGAVVLNANGTFTYTPATGYSGTDTFTYEVNDGTVNSNVATVTLNIAHVAPVANAVTVSGTEGQVASGTINATDAITSAVLTPSVVTAPAHGTVALNANGTFTYTPATGFSGADTFTYEVNDGTVNSNVATITVNVAHVAPVANGVTINATEGQVASGSINATDAITSAVLTPSVVSAPAHGTVALNANGTFTYTPATGYSGTDTFSYEVNDGSVNSNVATVTINVAHVAPVANAVTVSGTEGQIASGTINATDAITSAVLTPSVVSAPAHGTVVLNANGTFTYTPATGFSGADTFTYEVNDGTVNSNVATITVNVAHVAPVANGMTINGIEGQVASGTINATDAITSAVLTPSVVTAPAHGTVALNANGTFTYTPSTGYSGTDTFTYEVNDGSVNSNIATVTINVAHVAPVANAVTVSGQKGK